jgi:hypothetical protein
MKEKNEEKTKREPSKKEGTHEGKNRSITTGKGQT